MGQVILKALNKITIQFFIRVITIKRFLLHLHLSLQAPNFCLTACIIIYYVRVRVVYV